MARRYFSEFADNVFEVHSPNRLLKRLEALESEGAEIVSILPTVRHETVQVIYRKEAFGVRAESEGANNVMV